MLEMESWPTWLSILRVFADSLAGAGADIAAIAAITPHICIAEIQQRSKLPLVSLLDETVRDIDARGLRRVALFRNALLPSRAGSLASLTTSTWFSPDLRRSIASTVLISRLLMLDEGPKSTRRFFARLPMFSCKRDGVEAIVLAGTELALVFNENNTDFPAIDCARVHIDGIMREIVG